MKKLISTIVIGAFLALSLPNTASANQCGGGSGQARREALKLAMGIPETFIFIVTVYAITLVNWVSVLDPSIFFSPEGQTPKHPPGSTPTPGNGGGGNNGGGGKRTPPWDFTLTPTPAPERFGLTSSTQVGKLKTVLMGGRGLSLGDVAMAPGTVQCDRTSDDKKAPVVVNLVTGVAGDGQEPLPDCPDTQAEWGVDDSAKVRLQLGFGGGMVSVPQATILADRCSCGGTPVLATPVSDSLTPFGGTPLGGAQEGGTAAPETDKQKKIRAAALDAFNDSSVRSAIKAAATPENKAALRLARTNQARNSMSLKITY